MAITAKSATSYPSLETWANPPLPGDSIGDSIPLSIRLKVDGQARSVPEDVKAHILKIYRESCQESLKVGVVFSHFKLIRDKLGSISFQPISKEKGKAVPFENKEIQAKLDAVARSLNALGSHFELEFDLQKSSPSKLKRFFEALNITNDLNSATRSFLQTSTKVAVKTAGALTVLGLVGGVSSSVSGIGTFYGSVKEGKGSYKVGDSEGTISYASSALAGASTIVLGAGTITMRVGMMKAAAKTAAVGVKIIYFAAFPMYLIYLGIALYNMGTSLYFRSKLNEEMDLSKKLEWIRDQVEVTEKEAVGKTPEQIDKLLEKKRKKFERRVGGNAYHAALKIHNTLLDGIDRGEGISIKKGNEILAKVQEGNEKQILKNSIFMLTILIGLTVLILSLVLSGGTASILFGVAAIAALFIDCDFLYEKTANGLWTLLYKKKEKQSTEEIEMASLISTSS